METRYSLFKGTSDDEFDYSISFEVGQACRADASTVDLLTIWLSREGTPANDLASTLTLTSRSAPVSAVGIEADVSISAWEHSVSSSDR